MFYNISKVGLRHSRHLRVSTVLLVYISYARKKVEHCHKAHLLGIDAQSVSHVHEGMIKHIFSELMNKIKKIVFLS